MWMRISGWCQDPRREPLEKAGERACPLEADRAGLESGSASLALGTQVLHLNDANMLHAPGDKMDPVVPPSRQSIITKWPSLIQPKLSATHYWGAVNGRKSQLRQAQGAVGGRWAHRAHPRGKRSVWAHGVQTRVWRDARRPPGPSGYLLPLPSRGRLPPIMGTPGQPREAL